MIKEFKEKNERMFDFNLQLFADDNADQDANIPGDNTDTQTDTAADKAEEKLFKQEDVNNIVARESKKATEKLLKELGIEDFDNAKDGLAKFREWQDSQKTEQEKQAETLKALETDRDNLSKENEFLKAQISAMKEGVKADSVEDVVVLAERLVSDDVTIDDAIKQVVEKYPHFAEEVEEEDNNNPNFTTGIRKKSDGDNNPFAAKLAKYK